MSTELKRQVGFLVLDVTMSNPNGDPDMESEPRTRELDGLGMISPVSLKRKFRDLVDETSEVFSKAKEKYNLGSRTGNEFKILESRGRHRDEIKEMDKETFKKNFWDARLFGNTFLESLKDGDTTVEELLGVVYLSHVKNMVSQKAKRISRHCLRWNQVILVLVVNILTNV